VPELLNLILGQAPKRMCVSDGSPPTPASDGDAWPGFCEPERNSDRQIQRIKRIISWGPYGESKTSL
jgi:hypothetical protein